MEELIQGVLKYLSIDIDVRYEPDFENVVKRDMQGATDVISAKLDPYITNSNHREIASLATAIGIKAQKRDGQDMWLFNDELIPYINMISYRTYQENPSRNICTSKTISASTAKKFCINHLRLFRIMAWCAINGKSHTNLSDEDWLAIVEWAYLHWRSIGISAGGHDMFSFLSSVCTVHELTSILDRYTDWEFYCILNTKTFSSGSGEHWVGFVATKPCLYLMCPCGKGFDNFKGDTNNLEQWYNYTLSHKYSKTAIQRDSKNCGAYSVICLYNFDKNNFKAIDELTNIHEHIEEYRKNLFH